MISKAGLIAVATLWGLIGAMVAAVYFLGLGPAIVVGLIIALSWFVYTLASTQE